MGTKSTAPATEDWWLMYRRQVLVCTGRQATRCRCLLAPAASISADKDAPAESCTNNAKLLVLHAIELQTDTLLPEGRLHSVVTSLSACCCWHHPAAMNMSDVTLALVGVICRTTTSSPCSQQQNVLHSMPPCYYQANSRNSRHTTLGLICSRTTAGSQLVHGRQLSLMC